MWDRDSTTRHLKPTRTNQASHLSGLASPAIMEIDPPAPRQLADMSESFGPKLAVFVDIDTGDYDSVFSGLAPPSVTVKSDNPIDLEL